MAKLNLDCLWLDKNQIYAKSIQSYSDSNIFRNKLKYIFTPGGIDIQNNNIPLDSFVNGTFRFVNSTFDGDINQAVSELNMHSLFRVLQAKHSFKTMNELQNVQRPFLLSTAYFSGMSQFAAKFEQVYR